MICLDTNIIVDFLRGNEATIQQIKKLVSQNQTIFITILTVCELYKGVFLSKQPEKHQQQLEAFLKTVRVLELNLEACQIYAKNYKKLKDSGKQTQEFDLLISSITIAHEKTFITKNTKHFKNIPHLKTQKL